MGQPPQAPARNPVLAVCLGLGLAAGWVLPFVRVAPNRLLSGEPVLLAQLLPAPAWMAVAVAIALLFYAVLRPQSILSWNTGTSAFGKMCFRMDHAP